MTPLRLFLAGCVWPPWVEDVFNKRKPSHTCACDAALPTLSAAFPPPCSVLHRRRVAAPLPPCLPLLVLLRSRLCGLSPASSLGSPIRWIAQCRFSALVPLPRGLPRAWTPAVYDSLAISNYVGTNPSSSSWAKPGPGRMLFMVTVGSLPLWSPKSRATRIVAATRCRAR